MPTSIENKKRIAKNTLLLYFRMLFLVIINLYTSRVILSELGVDDFGIYSVVGGFVAMFGMISDPLTGAISRFLTFELGRNSDKLRETFSSAITIQITLSIVILLFAETLGIWYLNTWMNIQAERVLAANWVFQFSVITFITNLLSVPYNATIIAHEKMSAFAYISIFEGLGTLSIALLITISPLDKLIFYSLLMCVMAFLVRYIYIVYCKRNFEECCFKFAFNKPILKSMCSYAGWTVIGAGAYLFKNQGVDVILNLFCGTAVNGAKGIGTRVNGIVYSFSGNFMKAMNPQITKSYAEGNKEYMYDLIYRGTRFSFYLLFLISLPVLMNTQYLLQLWLGIVPQYSVGFVQLLLISSLVELLYGPLTTAHLATGKIKELQIVIGLTNLLNMPFSYIALRLGCNPTITVAIALFLSIIGLFLRIYLYKRIEDFSLMTYIKTVLLKIVYVILLALILPVLIKPLLAVDLYGFILMCMICTVSTLMVIYLVGLDKKEKLYLKAKKNAIIKS